MVPISNFLYSLSPLLYLLLPLLLPLPPPPPTPSFSTLNYKCLRIHASSYPYSNSIVSLPS